MSSTTAPGMAATARDLLALAKPNVTMLVLITTAGGLWLAPGRIGWSALFATLAGTVLVVAAANTLNCWWERESDQHMARTRNRPLPAGRMKPAVALALGLGLALVSVPLLTALVNPLTGLLAAIALVSYVLVYTPMKQISPHAVIIGSIPGAMPPLMGWTAVTGSLDVPGLVLFSVLFIWQIPHFIAISLYRQQEYARAGIRTVPEVYGVNSAHWQLLGWSILLVPVSLALVPLGVAGRVYLGLAAVLGAGLLVLAARGLRTDKPVAWARNYFLYTLAYLTLLFAALLVDAGPVHG
jgi:heme o synthase